MRQIELVILKRDTRAILIPDGEPTTLPEGTHVRITQSLGGSYTVMTDYGQMFRIDAADADALGKQAAASADAQAEGALEDRIWEQLKTCYDPEIPVNIVDLGLVYNCEVEDSGDGGHRVNVKMTLTAPGCGMGDILADDVKRRVEQLPEVTVAEVELVFDPPWNQNMMSEAARLELGMF
jgi:probable FeS assembly SUF system protein SufT